MIVISLFSLPTGLHVEVHFTITIMNTITNLFKVKTPLCAQLTYN